MYSSHCIATVDLDAITVIVEGEKNISRRNCVCGRGQITVEESRKTLIKYFGINRFYNMMSSGKA